MESVHGLLRVRVRRGIDLAIRDTRSSDPYVVVTMAHQKLRTRVVKRNCNPEWNDELTLSISDSDIETPIITLEVYDEDTLSFDDKMGSAVIDMNPLIECLEMDLESDGLTDGSVVKRVDPTRENCLSEPSACVWKDGKITQEMRLRLRDVECGEIVVEIEWIDIHRRRGLMGRSLKSPSPNNGLESLEASSGLLKLEATT